MAQKRMFDKYVIDSDYFLEMPLTSQALYFHLSMRADDDGFIDNWKSIMRIIGAKEDDIKVLISKSFIIPFDSGVIVIKHWRINNYLQKDRKKNTRHFKELQTLKEVNGEYFLLENNEISNILLIENENKEIPEWQIKRDEAYKNSSLPYSFLYKIRNAFIGEKCPICGNIMNVSSVKKYMPSIQHLIPISKGGKHEIDNIAIVCLSCNSSLRDKICDNKLNNELVIKKWQNIINNSKEYLFRLTSGNIDKNSIDKNSIDNIYIVEQNSTVTEVINYLNNKVGSNYKPTTKKTSSLINARLKEGFTLEDFKTVIDKKTKEWLNTDMAKFLRPETLFSNKFESYLNQLSGGNLPKWIDKQVEINHASKEEIEELKELLKEFN